MRGSARRGLVGHVGRSMGLKLWRKLLPPFGVGWDMVFGAGGGGLRFRQTGSGKSWGVLMLELCVAAGREEGKV